MFEIKPLNFGFAILYLEPNPTALANTVKSLRVSHPNYPVITAVPSNLPAGMLKEIKQFLPAYKGKTTVTSLMNVAMKNATTEWVIFLVAGAWVKQKICNKLSRFIMTETDIVFPISENIYDFPNCTLNGLCINKSNFDKIGPFEEDGELATVKERWSILAAAINGCAFKAIAGVRVV